MNMLNVSERLKLTTKLLEITNTINENYTIVDDDLKTNR